MRSVQHINKGIHFLPLCFITGGVFADYQIDINVIKPNDV